MSFEWLLMSISIMDSKVTYRVNSCRFWLCYSRLSWFWILRMRKWAKKNRMWWEVLPSNAWRYQEKIWFWTNREVGTGMEIDSCCPCLECYTMEMIKVLQIQITILFIIFSPYGKTWIWPPRNRGKCTGVSPYSCTSWLWCKKTSW